MYIASEVTFILVLYHSSVFAMEPSIQIVEQESILLNEVLTELPHHQCDLLVISSDFFKGEMAKVFHIYCVKVSEISHSIMFCIC